MTDTATPHPRFVYKICSAELWQQACDDGQFTGAPIDRTDGFIHFSTDAQMAETAAKHFAGQTGLKLLQIDTSVVEITWEVSRGGKLFPHLYDILPLSAVLQVWNLPLGKDGVHQFPDVS